MMFSLLSHVYLWRKSERKLVQVWPRLCAFSLDCTRFRKTSFAKTNGEVISATFIICVFWFTNQLAVNKTKLCVVIVTSHSTSAATLSGRACARPLVLRNTLRSSLSCSLGLWVLTQCWSTPSPLVSCEVVSCGMKGCWHNSDQNSFWQNYDADHVSTTTYSRTAKVTVRWTSNQRVMPTVVGGSMRTQNTQMSKRKPTENKTCPIQWSFRKIEKKNCQKPTRMLKKTLEIGNFLWTAVRKRAWWEMNFSASFQNSTRENNNKSLIQTIRITRALIRDNTHDLNDTRGHSFY